MNTTTIQLPADRGRSISHGGVEYVADDRGRITVPADVAAELAPHLNATPHALPVAFSDSAREVLDEIKRIDADLADVRKQKRELEGARAKAHEIADAPSAAAQEEANLQDQKAGLVGDMLLGKIEPIAVAEHEAKRRAAAVRAQEERQHRDLGALGVDELNARIAPLDRRERALLTQRSVAARRAIRVSAEDVAVVYRKVARELAHTFAVLAAHAAELDAIERASGRIAGVQVDGGQQSFGVFSGPELARLPAFPTLSAFAPCKSWQFVLALHPQAGGLEHVDAAQIRASVRAGLVDKGLIAR